MAAEHGIALIMYVHFLHDALENYVGTREAETVAPVPVLPSVADIPVAAYLSHPAG